MDKFLSQYVARRISADSPANLAQILAYIEGHLDDTRVLDYIFFEIMEGQELQSDSRLTVRQDSDVLQLLYPIFLQGSDATLNKLRENFPNAYNMLQIIYALNQQEDIGRFFRDDRYKHALEDLLYMRAGPVLTPQEYARLKQRFGYDICRVVPPDVKSHNHIQSLITYQPCGVPQVGQILHMLAQIMKKCGGIGLDYSQNCPDDKTLDAVFEFLQEQLGGEPLDLDEKFVRELLARYDDEQVVAAVFVLSEFLPDRQQRVQFLLQVVMQSIAAGRWQLSYQIIPSYETADIMEEILRELEYEEFKKWFRGAPLPLRLQYARVAHEIVEQIFRKRQPVGDERENSAFALWLISTPKERQYIERRNSDIFYAIADVL